MYSTGVTRFFIITGSEERITGAIKNLVAAKKKFLAARLPEGGAQLPTGDRRRVAADGVADLVQQGGGEACRFALGDDGQDRCHGGR